MGGWKEVCVEVGRGWVRGGKNNKSLYLTAEFSENPYLPLRSM